MLRLPKRENLRGTFADVAGMQYADVPGVVRLQSRNPKCKVVISAMTHGNEPAGLAAILFLMENKNLLKNVDLFLVVSNLDAGARFWQAKSPAEKERCRYFVHNMNRIPLDFGSSRYAGDVSELKRAQQLWDGVFGDVTHILDVHSADQPLPGGLTLDIAGERSVLDTISDALPAVARLAEITPVQKAESKNQPFGCLAGHGAAVALEVEAGAHEDEPGIRVAVETAVSFLKALDCIEGDVEKGSPTTQDVYDVRGVVRVPDASYRIASEALLPNFAPITAGQPIAVSDGKQPVVAPEDGHLIFGPEGLEISEQLAKEEVFFRLGPVEHRQRVVQVPTWFDRL